MGKQGFIFTVIYMKSALLPYKAIVIDDEQHAIDSLTSLLRHFREITVVRSFLNPTIALDYITTHSADLVFLDIRMPDITGIEFAQKLIEIHLPVRIIFTTAHDEYILEALRKNAVDYLLKPVSLADLSAAVERFKTLEEENWFKNIQNFLKTAERNKIRFNTRTGFITIFEDEIVYIKADGVYSQIVLKNGKSLTVSQNIGNIQTQLKLDKFIKIHRSVIVNGDYIFEICRGKKECSLAIGARNIKLPFSSEGLKIIEKYLGG